MAAVWLRAILATRAPRWSLGEHRMTTWKSSHLRARPPNRAVKIVTHNSSGTCITSPWISMDITMATPTDAFIQRMLEAADRLDIEILPPPEG